MDVKTNLSEKQIETHATQAGDSTKRAGSCLHKKPVSDLDLHEARERLVKAEQTIEKQKRKILDLQNVLCRQGIAALWR